MFRYALIAFLLFTLGSSLAAQGSQQVIGGGCPTRSPATVTGKLAIGTTLEVQDLGCFGGAAGSLALVLGTRLPQASWIPLTLECQFNGSFTAPVVINPLLTLPVKGAALPYQLPIPNDPTLVGAKFSMQSVCNECGIVPCYIVLTPGIEITIG